MIFVEENVTNTHAEIWGLFPVAVMHLSMFSPRGWDFIFDRIFIKLAGNKDSHKISTLSSMSGPELSIHFGVIRP